MKIPLMPHKKSFFMMLFIELRYCLSFGSLFGGIEDPQQTANQYYEQTPDAFVQYLSSIAQHGNDVYGGLQGQYNRLMNDPDSLKNIK